MRLEEGAKNETAENSAVGQPSRESLDEGPELSLRALASVETELKEAAAQLQSVKTELADLRAQLGSRNETVANLSAQNDRLGAEIQLRNSEMQTRGAEITDLASRIRIASARIASLNQSNQHREVASAKQRVAAEGLAKKNQILKEALDIVEMHFRRLTQSRSFQFAVYTARRLGLVSRTPRRCVEAIKHKFPETRKALKKVGKQYPSDAGPAPTARGLERDLRESEESADIRAALRKAASDRHAIALPPVASPENASVCFIVLHHVGENDLRNFFDSFLRVNTHPSVEFSLVLHACMDGSREVIASFQERLRIKVTDCSDNHSFSYSNNRAAEETSADYLVFVNDDIVFQEDIVGELLRCLQDPATGLAGARLLYPLNHPDYPGGIQHAGIKFKPDPMLFFYRPFNLGAPAQIAEVSPLPERFPAVTAALVACRRRDFQAVGGFCESYLYGYEDVDLALSFRRALGLRSVSANQISCIHNESATGRRDATTAVRQRRLNNINHLVRRHGWYLRRAILVDKLAGNLFFSERQLTVAFAVTEATHSTAAGDFFTALELAEACQKEFGWNIRYLSRQEDWYNLKDIDVLVVLLDAYELSRIRNAKPDLVKIAWLRNWFERWASGPDFEQYDLFLCSSARSARWLQKTHRKPAHVFPLATNAARFSAAQAEDSLKSDYCFTGSYWEFEREISTSVRPDRLEGYKFLLFGKGWEKHPRLGPYAQGLLPYVDMPKVYASTRVVVDDANHVTKDWGSVNSRVFDALTAGALVISNGNSGIEEVFAGELPTYSSPEQLHSLLAHYLGNERERLDLTNRLRQRVLGKHTYCHRARTLKRFLVSHARNRYRIAFKIGAPTRDDIQHWGDYHFALSLGRCFAEQGHPFRIDCIDEWERTESFGDDVVIVLRGLSRYRTQPGQINLMWNISHPDKIQDEEYNEFDHVFVASESYAANLAERLQSTVSPLLQCTDPHVFFPDPNPEVKAEEILFVGNSRKQYREAVQFAIRAEMPIAVYGTHWPIFIPDSYIRGEYIENSILRQHYSRCDILLNDHWPSMRERGFASNRIFDAAAAGTFVLSDTVKGMEQLFGKDLTTYRSEDEFRLLVRYYLEHPEERSEKAARLREHVLAGHTFAHRATVILQRVRELDKLKRSGEALRNVPVSLTHA